MPDQPGDDLLLAGTGFARLLLMLLLTHFDTRFYGLSSDVYIMAVTTVTDDCYRRKRDSGMDRSQFYCRILQSAPLRVNIEFWIDVDQFRWSPSIVYFDNYYVDMRSHNHTQR